MRRLRHLSDDLPFDFNCGFVGYFGYELKADCGGSDAHRSTMPDAAFVFADRLIAFDHLEQCTYVLCVAEPGERRGRPSAGSPRRACGWPRCRRCAPSRSGTAAQRAEPVDFRLSRSHEQYLEDIATCKQRLIEGETYEICLTNKITAEVSADPLRALPHAAPRQPGAVLRLPALRRARRAQLLARALPQRSAATAGSEAKPIKGTCRARRDAGRGRAPGRGAARSARRTAPRT